MTDQRIFTCPTHQFVTVVRGTELDCHGSPGLRVTGCESCDKVVDDAFAWADD